MKKIVSGIAFFIILILILLVLGYVLSPDFLSKNDIVDKKGDVNSRLDREEPDSLDVIILGDSESYTSISPMELWRNYGYASYNFGQVGATLSDVKEAYRTITSKQQPKIVLLETNALYRGDTRNDEANNFITRTIYKVLPVTKYHDNWKVPFQDRREGNYKGFTISHTVDPCENTDYMIPTDKEENIISDNNKTLEEINDLCRKNNATLILYSAPSPPNYNYAKHNALSKLAKELGVEYIDLNLANDEMKIDYTTDTRDGGDHLNVYGAIKATGYIGRWLNERYELPDRRLTDIAPSWNDLLNEYTKEINE